MVRVKGVPIECQQEIFGHILIKGLHCWDVKCVSVTHSRTNVIQRVPPTPCSREPHRLLHALSTRLGGVRPVPSTRQASRQVISKASLNASCSSTIGSRNAPLQDCFHVLCDHSRETYWTGICFLCPLYVRRENSGITICTFSQIISAKYPDEDAPTESQCQLGQSYVVLQNSSSTKVQAGKRSVV